MFFEFDGYGYESHSVNLFAFINSIYRYNEKLKAVAAAMGP